MSVYAALAEEHRLLWSLVARLERGLAAPDEWAARRESRGVLLVFLRALEGHERIEAQVYDTALPELPPEAADALELVERQHAAIARIREEASELAADAERLDLGSLRAMATELAGALRGHFATEERELWPRLNALPSRSVRRDVDRRARERVRALARELAGELAAVDEARTPR